MDKVLTVRVAWLTEPLDDWERALLFAHGIRVGRLYIGVG